MGIEFLIYGMAKLHGDGFVLAWTLFDYSRVLAGSPWRFSYFL